MHGEFKITAHLKAQTNLLVQKSCFELGMTWKYSAH